DRDRIAQVCQNLLANAIKYSPEGGEIVVRVEVLDGTARVTVRDHGIGIAPHALTHLFERFYRGATAEAHGKGLGLGLFISRALVEAHGGAIWAQSDGERLGSTFGFSLPCAPTAAGDVAAGAANPDPILS